MCYIVILAHLVLQLEAYFAYVEAIDNLFIAIEGYIDRPKIPSDYLSGIDAFMKNEKDYQSEGAFRDRRRISPEGKQK